MASPIFPEPPSSIAATSMTDCDRAVDEVSAAAPQWVAMSPSQRAVLLRQCMGTLKIESAAWVASTSRAKGHQPGSGGEGEEWVNGIMPVMRNLRLFAEALERGGQPRLPAVNSRSDGQRVVKVFPTSNLDKVMLTGYSAEVWIEPGKEATQGAIYRNTGAGEGGEPRVALVLGAGNQASIGPMDVLYKMVVDDEVCVLKMNPVNDYLGPHYERALSPLVERGMLRIVYGGAEVGQHLCNHPDVHSIHITGSERTHDAIVWGGDAQEQARRKGAGERQNLKPISSELGAVSPILVVPGDWTDADLDFQARQVTSMVVQNASFNCNAGKVLILAEGWAQKGAFLGRIRHHLGEAPQRRAFYPGAQDRYQRFLDTYPSVDIVGERSDDVVPWTILKEVPAKAGEYALTTEAFCGVLAVTELPATEAADYLDQAVVFANEVIWGTLSCNLIVHPKSEAQLDGGVDRAIAGLRYGAIGVNCWSGLVYGLCNTTWGAFPGHPLEDIQSGQGTVHNAFLLDHPQKSVCRAPWRIKPTAAWFVDHRNLRALGKKLVEFELRPSWFRLMGVAAAALRG